MFHEEDQGVRGITPELLIEDLARNDAGYVLEVTTDGYGDNVITEGGPCNSDTIYGEIDFGTPDAINEDLGTNLSNENCVNITGNNGSVLTVVANGDIFAVSDNVEQDSQQFDTKEELVQVVDNWVRQNGKPEVVENDEDNDWDDDTDF